MFKQAVIYSARQGEKDGSSHNIADSLAVEHSWQHTFLEIRFYFTRCSPSHFPHHSTMCTFHHATKGSMECQIVKAVAVIDINNAFLVLQERMLTTIQIRQ
jgi:hypothetical protein